MTYLRTGTSLAALAASAFLASPAIAQEEAIEPEAEASARKVVLSIAEELEFQLDGATGFVSTTTLGLEATTETRTQELRFTAETDLDIDLRGGSDISFADQYLLGLRYVRRSSNGDMTFSANLLEADLGLDTFEIEPGILIIGEEDASLEVERYRIRLRQGLQGPFGFTIDGRFRDADFTNTIDPETNDEKVYSVDALARFGVSRSLDFRARAGIRKSEEDDIFVTERETKYAGLGIGGTTASGLSFSADVLFDQTETTTATPISLSEDDGVGFELALTKPRPNGSYGIGLSSRIDAAGRRTQADFRRTMGLPDGGIAFSLGVVDQEGVDDLQVIGGVSYTVARKNTDISASLQQAATTDEGDTIISTDLALAYRRQITEVSAWEAELGYLATDQLLANDYISETRATVGYRRDLTSDWTMFTGAEVRKTDGGSAEKTLFFNIERDITFGF